MVRYWRTALVFLWIAIGLIAFRQHRGLWYRPQTRAHETFDLLGAVLLVAGGGLRIWASMYIRPCKGKSLSTSGPYSLCRHPLYLGSLLALLGLCFVAQSTFIVIGSLLLWIPAYSIKMGIEEYRLGRKYGPSWHGYRAVTPLLLPRGRTTPGKSIDAPPRKLSDGLIELPGVLMFVAIGILLELLEYRF